MLTKSTLLDEQLERLASFEPAPFPVISLYLDTRADQHGRDNYELFLRQELRPRCESFPAGSSDRESFEADLKKIETYLREQLQPSTNAVAIFACSGAQLFDVVALDAPIEGHELYVYNRPHLFTLARLNDQYPRYALVIADTNKAHIYVFGLRALLATDQVESPKMSRVQGGGWSQARYQRRLGNMQMQHVKEVVEALDRIVRAENIQHIILSGDDVVIPMLKEELPATLSEKVVDVLRLNMYADGKQMLEQTLESMRQNDAQTDQEKVEAMIGEYRRGGLAVAGPESTLAALDRGQVLELFVPTAPEQIQIAKKKKAEAAAPGELDTPNADTMSAKVADALVTKAKETGAQICFVENGALLRPVRGVGATLRYRYDTKPQEVLH